MSILEAVIALVILSGATLSVVALFHTGLRRQAHSDDRMQAVAIAQRHLEQYRVKARETAGFEELEALQGTYAPDPLQPEFEVAALARWATVVSPCSGFYELLDDDDRERVLDKTARWVTVGVRWAGPGSRVVLQGMITEPIRALDNPPLVKVWALTPIPNPLPHNQGVELQAQLVDKRGLPVEGARFRFWVKPKKAVATLRKYRNGLRVKVINRVAHPQVEPDDRLPPSNNESYDLGETIITARGRYYGRELLGSSPPIELGGP